MCGILKSMIKSLPVADRGSTSQIILVTACFAIGVIGSFVFIFMYNKGTPFLNDGDKDTGEIKVPKTLTIEQKTQLLADIGHISSTTTSTGTGSTDTDHPFTATTSTVHVGTQQADPSDKHAAQKLNLLNSLHTIH